MCGLFLTGAESRSVFEETRSLEVLTPGPSLNIHLNGYQVMVAQWLACWLATGEVQGSNPSKGESIFRQI